MDPKTAKRHAIVAGAIVVLGLLTVIITKRLDYPAEGFWDTYVIGFRGIGWMSMLIGGVWAAFSCIAIFSDFYKVERPISTENYTVTMSIIVVATLVLMAATVPSVDLYADDKKLSGTPEQQAVVIKHKTNLKWLVILGFLAGGTIAASVPTRRFFRSA